MKRAPRARMMNTEWEGVSGKEDREREDVQRQRKEESESAMPAAIARSNEGRWRRGVLELTESK